MIELPVTQNTPQWHAQRAGIPTASGAKHLITPTGIKAIGEAVESYMYQLCYERMAESPIVSFQSFWMERGHEEEVRAVNLYQFSRDVETEPCGFFLNDSRTAGASPDRKIIDKKAGLEIKAPMPKHHLMYLDKSGSAWKTYYPQLQFQLMVTGWDYVDLYSYHPDLPPALILTEPKKQYIEDLTNIVGEFSIELEKTYARFVDMGLAPEHWRKAEQMPKPKAFSQLDAIQAVREAMAEMNK